MGQAREQKRRLSTGSNRFARLSIDSIFDTYIYHTFISYFYNGWANMRFSIFNTHKHMQYNYCFIKKTRTTYFIFDVFFNEPTSFHTIKEKHFKSFQPIHDAVLSIYLKTKLKFKHFFFCVP